MLSLNSSKITFRVMSASSEEPGSNSHMTSGQCDKDQVTTETITRVQVPMLRPRPDLLQVLRLAGGIGETFTMREIIGLVRDYIQERNMYDRNDPKTVYCQGDLLGRALGVDTFTVMQAIQLFQKNCFLEPDSCIRIHRQLTTRAVPSDSQSDRPIETLSNSPPTGQPTRHPVTARVLDSETTVSSSSQSCTQDIPPSSSCGAPSSGSERTSPNRGSVDTSSQQPSSSSQSSLPSSSPSSSQNPQTFHAPSSISSPMTGLDCGDEVDGLGEPWCQVTLETQGVHLPQDDTVVVNYDSDTFSVEYEVESSTDTEPGPTSLTSTAQPHRQHNSSESDVSSTASATAMLVVYQESDVEYLADYSDSDRGSDAELSLADKWHCRHCNIGNPPFQRNCSGCWTVRPDWLPSAKPHQGKGDNLPPTPKDVPTEAGSQDSALGSCLSSLDVQRRRRKRKWKHSSSPDLSDSPEEKCKNVKVEQKSACHETEKAEPCACQSLCVICYSRRKNACLIHGKTSHFACCYRCAKRLKAERRACPLCRRPIQKVVKTFFCS